MLKMYKIVIFPKSGFTFIAKIYIYLMNCVSTHLFLKSQYWYPVRWNTSFFNFEVMRFDRQKKLLIFNFNFWINLRENVDFSCIDRTKDEKKKNTYLQRVILFLMKIFTEPIFFTLRFHFDEKLISIAGNSVKYRYIFSTWLSIWLKKSKSN